MLEQLQVANEVVGVCEPLLHRQSDYSKGDSGRNGSRFREATSPMWEQKMIDINVEAILVSPFENAGYGPAEKLGLPIIECAGLHGGYPLGWRNGFVSLLYSFEKRKLPNGSSRYRKAYLDIRSWRCRVSFKTYRVV